MLLFTDKTPDEIDTNNIGRIKAALTTRIKDATYTLVIIGKYANKIHKHAKLIGFKNWINFEIYQSRLNKNKIVAIKIDKSYESPEELKGVGASWAMSFTEEAIMKTIKDAG